MSNKVSNKVSIKVSNKVSIGQSIWDERGKSGQKSNFPFTRDGQVKTRTSEKPPGRPDRGRKRGRVRGNRDVW